MNIPTPSATTSLQTFRPPAFWRWAYGLGAMLALAAFVGSAWLAWLARGQDAFALWLAVAALTAFLTPGLAFGWWWVRRVHYALTPTALHLHAPGAQATVPVESIAWAGVEAHYDRPLPPAPWGWPGLLVGLVAPENGPTVAFYGLTRARRVVLEDADGRVFVLTPADVGAFLAVLRARLEAEATTPAEEKPPVPREDAPASETLPPHPEPAQPVLDEETEASRRSALVPGAQVQVPLPAWALVGVAWLVSLAVVVWVSPRLATIPSGLRYALYVHLVILGAETGGGRTLFTLRRPGYAYALWGAGLLATLGLAWALGLHGG